jgi:hypothetical protein
MVNNRNLRHRRLEHYRVYAQEAHWPHQLAGSLFRPRKTNVCRQSELDVFQLQIGRPAQQRANRDFSLDAGELGAEAVMDAAAE